MEGDHLLLHLLDVLLALVLAHDDPIGLLVEVVVEVVMVVVVQLAVLLDFLKQLGFGPIEVVIYNIV